MSAFLALVVFVAWIGILLAGDALLNRLVEADTLDRWVDRIFRGTR